jgi:serine/threonine protein kinase
MENTDIKQYSIKQKIGEGGMSEIFLAYDNQLNHSVAIKKLKVEYVHSPNLRNRFVSEVKNMFKMNHPNVVKVYGLIEEGDFIGAVMEYIPGSSLDQYMKKHNVLNDNEIKHILCQMLEALKYVHSQGLIHRDVKPSNFILDDQANVKLLDFGIAKNLNTEISDYTSTGTVQQIGTPLYMSPEQIATPNSITQSTDIYSLGLVLYFLVNGKSPYDENSISLFELQMKIVTEDFQISKSSIWNSIIRKATQKKVENRFKNINEFEVAVQNLSPSNDDKSSGDLRNESSSNPVNNNSPRKFFASKKKTIIWLISSLLLIVLTIIGVFTYETEEEKIAACEKVVKTFASELELDIINKKLYPKSQIIKGGFYYLINFEITSSTVKDDGTVVIYGNYQRSGTPCSVKFELKKENGEYKIISSKGLSTYVDSPLLTYCIRKGYFNNGDVNETDEKIDSICEKNEYDFDFEVGFLKFQIEEHVKMSKSRSPITIDYNMFADGYVTIQNDTDIDLPLYSVKYVLVFIDSKGKVVYEKDIPTLKTLKAHSSIKEDVFISNLPATCEKYTVEVEILSTRFLEEIVAQNL